jgi:hypothetical protein
MTSELQYRWYLPVNLRAHLIYEPNKFKEQISLFPYLEKQTDVFRSSVHKHTNHYVSCLLFVTTLIY